MTGYSGTPLAKKLGIKGGSAVVVVRAAEGFVESLAPLPPGVKVVEGTPRGTGTADVLVVFCAKFADLKKSWAAARKALRDDGGMWVAWPKKSSGVATDLTEDVVRDYALAAGLVDNKVCAIDEVWSGLRLVVRVRDRTNGGTR